MKTANRILKLSIVVCILTGLHSAQARTLFLAFGKSKAVDPERMQQRAIDAVMKVTQAAARFQPSILCDPLTEDIMTRQQFLTRQNDLAVSGDILRGKLDQLTETVTTNDTVIIYSHSHGTKGQSADKPQTAGLVLDPGPFERDGSAIFRWDEYADRILAIPAKNVVVLTMACYSGLLSESLNAPHLRSLWENRRREGRSFIVLTSQNSELQSPPIVKNRELINPFTYAVAEALDGQADGFFLKDGIPGAPQHKDGRLTAGELIDFILYKTESTASEYPPRKNIAKPTVTGSYDRNAVILFSHED